MDRISLAALTGVSLFAGVGPIGLDSTNRAADPASVAGPSAPSKSDERCASLSALKLASVEIVSATVQPANAVVPGAYFPSPDGLGRGSAVAGLPSFCRVIGRIRPVVGSDIGFEVWMPTVGWNGRFTSGNNGGYGGYIDYSGLSAALTAGHASASTDTGHQAPANESAWARGNPQKIRDYGWRAVHLTTVNAKRIMARYYGRAPDKSYFVGCSNGGRQALMEASRFPQDYDGIVAGAPAARQTGIIMSMIATVQAQSLPGAALRPDQARFLQENVVRQCDAQDGQMDGLVADPRQCKVDIRELTCGASTSAQCLSGPQAGALAKIYAGARDSQSRQIAPGYPAAGAEAGFPLPDFGWESWLLGAPPRHNRTLPAGMLHDFVARPFADAATFDWDRDPARLAAAVGADLDVRPNLRPFFAKGGKLIIWQGWADAAVAPEHTLSFYTDVVRSSGPGAREAARLFMIPGLQHCFGGPGAGIFGQLGAPAASEKPERSLTMAMQHWVENGRAPNSVIGRRGLVPSSAELPDERQRLHCAWPNRDILAPGKDPDKAASYSCRALGSNGESAH